MIKSLLVSECVYALYPIFLILSFPLLIAFTVIRAIYKCLNNWGPQKSIEGQVALITGSGRGLGRRIAIELAKRGCHLAIVDIRGQLAVETAKFIAELYKVKTKAYKVDVTNYAKLEDLKIQITNDLGDVTILINNAGIMTFSTIEDPPFHEAQNMIAVNFNAVVYMTQIFLPKMKELSRGYILNVSSMSALVPINFCSIYAATKSAVRHFTSTVRVALMQERSNVTATTVMPTFLDTNEIVVNVLNYIDGNLLFPIVDGDLVVYHLVRGMLNGDDEMTVPRAFLYYYKLLELLPGYVREKLISLYTHRLMTKVRSDGITNILQQSDI